MMPNRPLTIALDARELPLGPSGDRTYLLELLREYMTQAPEWRFLLCYQNAPGTGVEGEHLPSNFETRRYAARPGWMWTPVVWPLMMRREGADIMHAQHIIPLLAPCPTIVTIHDVSFLRHPEWFPRRQRQVMARLIPLAAKRATRIVTGSRHAAQEVAELCRVSRDKIQVIPYGHGAHFTPGDRAAARARVARNYGLTTPYLLTVGLIQPRKNLPRVLEAFGRISRDHPDLHLAIAGRSGWDTEAILAPISRPGLRERVHLLGAVPDADLPDLYRAAAILVYPSLYEGFGLPPLEAMACGTPVIAASTSSLPEVIGDAGLLVNPLDAEAIAAAIRRVLEEPGLAEALRTSGPQRAARFSWRRCAQAHLELYRQLSS